MARLENSKANWPKEWLQELKSDEADAVAALKLKIKAHRELRRLAGFPILGKDLVEKNEDPVTAPVNPHPPLRIKQDDVRVTKDPLPRKRSRSNSPKVEQIQPSRKSQRKLQKSQSKITEHFAFTPKKALD
jgi:hypothetical protein